MKKISFMLIIGCGLFFYVPSAVQSQTIRIEETYIQTTCQPCPKKPVVKRKPNSSKPKTVVKKPVSSKKTGPKTTPVPDKPNNKKTIVDNSKIIALEEENTELKLKLLERELEDLLKSRDLLDREIALKEAEKKLLEEKRKQRSPQTVPKKP